MNDTSRRNNPLFIKDNSYVPEGRTEYMQDLMNVSELTALRVLQETGQLKPYLKLSEAKRMYGPGTVNRWIKDRVIRTVKDVDGTNVRIDRIEIRAAAMNANRRACLPGKDS